LCAIANSTKVIKDLKFPNFYDENQERLINSYFFLAAASKKRYDGKSETKGRVLLFFNIETFTYYLGTDEVFS